ncbi:Retrovirus-related Pol polyprotein from type-2 retrotransposable element R2DM [Gossypium australe]|uniref:Retrovirus-related Pol polyprotein from type-2 retrotransposable element R2DM n=1 Tax=Gossypium australe TaxID=47621 RepID=A0A5B6VT20_9ROSI|nr:Retrovirus-related Pol polyprotein from type-2 retrotransposable element R2DM [Gossypium australe]
MGSSMQILWNGGYTNEFRPSRGVRKGDPLSPYPFVLCMERLGHCIKQATENEIWEVVRLSEDGLNDLVLFCKANIHQANMMNEIVQKFRRCSGYKVNKSKSQVFFLKTVENALATK